MMDRRQASPPSKATAAPSRVEPVRIGPTWQRNESGWVLPEFTLGWDVLGWTAEWLQLPDGRPWQYTPEQARFVLWWFAVDETGRFLYRDGVLQRLKGWGKDPLAATLAAVELVGPCRVSHMESDGPRSKDHPQAWVQIAATSRDQTRNTMTLFPGLFSKRALEEFHINLGKEIIYAYQGARRIEAVTSSPRALEGGRPTLVIKNETQHWLSNNEGHEMAAVIDRNSVKSPDGASRYLSITNAPEPSEDSVALRERDAWEQMSSGKSMASGMLYDSLEAPPEVPLSAEVAPAVIEAVRGDSVWLNIDRIVQAILDPRNPPSRSRRFWYNQIIAAEDAWVTPQQVDAAARPDAGLEPSDEIVMFFDGSKSDDATALVGCRLSDGHVVSLGVWEKPPGARGVGWSVNRFDVDQVVRDALDTFRVAAFFADPSHTKDDEDATGFWDGIIDGWHQDYGDRFRLWSVQSGAERHSVMWDMTNQHRIGVFTKSAERFTAELAAGDLTHNGHPALMRHLKNARRAPNKHGVSLMKEHRESARKIDLAVAAVGARMLRRMVLNRGDKDAGKRPGNFRGMTR
jgi:hypothetical protein